MNELQEIILLVDDSTETLGMYNEALSSAGYTVLVALDGEQAIRIAERITPDIILLDAVMPVMDGFETCQHFKSDSVLAEVPVIFMTGLGETEHIVHGFQSGGTDYLQKPINHDELLARIRVHLNSSRIARSTRRALDEVSQPAFASDLSGNLIWATQRASGIFSALGEDAWGKAKVAEQIRQWLIHSPKRNSILKLTGLEIQLQVQFLARSTPTEFLFQIIDLSEGGAIEAIRLEFGLTEREAEVSYWLAQGKTNREIAQILEMSPRTVSKHLETVFRKLGVENRTSAAARCIQVLYT